MILTYCYRLLPSKPQHRALEASLEGQRQLYNAALEERIGAFRHAGSTRTYVDQCRALTERRQDDPEAGSVPLCLQRWTLKQVDEAYRGFFRRVKAGAKPGFPRFQGRLASIASAFENSRAFACRTAACGSPACRAGCACIFTATCPMELGSAPVSSGATKRAGR